MESISVAHELPELYRLVLERVASLEHTGRRDEALLIRRAAIDAYSRAWDDTALGRMSSLQARAERVLDGIERPRAARPPRPARPAFRPSRTA